MPSPRGGRACNGKRSYVQYQTFAGVAGVGAAFERSPEAALAVVRREYVSVERAWRDYGIVVLEQGREFTLDLNGTLEIREKGRATN